MPDKLRVLLIDDDADFIAINRIAIEAAGYEVISATNGQAGEEAARLERPDVIVLDVMMDTPTEGFEIARQLRADPDLKSTPLIMLTGVNQEDIPWRFDKDDEWLPVDVFLDKPVDTERLVAEINKSLGN